MKKLLLIPLFIAGCAGNDFVTDSKGNYIQERIDLGIESRTPIPCEQCHIEVVNNDSYQNLKFQLEVGCRFQP